MQKLTFSFLVAIISVVALAHLSEAFTLDEFKDYLVGYLISSPENSESEPELRAKPNSELIDMVLGVLNQRKDTATPEQGKTYGEHIEYFKSMKHSDAGKAPNQPGAPAAPADPNSKSMVHHVIDEEHFENLLKNAGKKLVVVDFTATWCGPCKAIAPHFKKHAETHKNKMVALKVDVDEMNPLAMDTYAVKAMPTFVFIKNGKEIDRIVGGDQAGLAGKMQQHI